MNEEKRKYQRKADNFDIGKLPPQVPDFEIAVLGACMLEKKAYQKISEKLTSNHFYVDSHQKIYEAIVRLDRAKAPIDILTVVNELKNTNDLEMVGGAYFVTTLTNRVASSVNIEFHAQIISQKFIARELIRISTETIQKAFDNETDIIQLAEDTSSTISKLVSFDCDDYSQESRIIETRKAIYDAMNNKGMYGVPTGKSELDKFLGGIGKEDLVVHGAFSGDFKTGLVLDIQHEMNKLNIPTAMFQMEMSKTGIGYREIAMESGLSMQDLRRGKLNEGQLNEMELAIGMLLNGKVQIDTSSSQTFEKIRAKTKTLIEEKGIKLVVIDYLQLADLGKKSYSSDESAISEFIKNLKSMAKEFQVPVWLLCQYSKEAEKHDPLKEPEMWFFKGSSAIRQFADIILMNWNPGRKDSTFVYVDNDKNNKKETPVKDKLGVLIAKNKNGDTGIIWLGAIPSINKFPDIAQQSNPDYHADKFTVPANTNFDQDVF